MSSDSPVTCTAVSESVVTLCFSPRPTHHSLVFSLEIKLHVTSVVIISTQAGEARKLGSTVDQVASLKPVSLWDTAPNNCRTHTSVFQYKCRLFAEVDTVS